MKRMWFFVLSVKDVPHGCACLFFVKKQKSTLLNVVSGPVFKASQSLVDRTVSLKSFFGNISNLRQHFTIAPCTKSLSSMYKPCEQTVTITVTGRPDFMINVYSKATETPLKADSPRLGTITSSLGDASSQQFLQLNGTPYTAKQLPRYRTMMLENTGSGFKKPKKITLVHVL